MKILVLNAGSSSQKSCLYEIKEPALPDYPLHPIWGTFPNRVSTASIPSKWAGL